MDKNLGMIVFAASSYSEMGMETMESPEVCEPARLAYGVVSNREALSQTK